MGSQKQNYHKVFELGEVFGSAARFFRTFDEEIDAAVSVRMAVPFKMQLGYMPEAQADTQFMPQEMPRMVQCGQSIVLFPLVAPDAYPDIGMPAVLADMHFGDIDLAQARVIHLKCDDLRQFLANRLRNPQCAPLIHNRRGQGPGAWGQGLGIRAPSGCWWLMGART